MNYEQEFKIAQRAYLEHFREILGELEVLILSLADPVARQESRRNLMRMLHSLKGTSGSYDLEAIKSLAHRLEDQVTSSSNEDKDAVALIEALLRGKDYMLRLCTAYAQNDAKALAEIKEEIGFLSNDGRPKDRSKTPAKSAAAFRVLLAESTTTIASRCKAAFKGTGAEVIWAKNGYEALGIALTEHFDAIITSALMPTIDGVNLRKILSLLGNPNHPAPYFVLTSEPERLRMLVDKDVVLIEKNENITSTLKEHFAKLLKSAGVEAQETKTEERTEAARILLVDDALDIHKLVALSFKKFPQVKIESLTNPLLALELGPEASFDAIVLDIQMPELDGISLMSKLKEKPTWKNCPIFFLTGTEDPKEAEKLRLKGAAGVFKKPFSPKTFGEQFLGALSALDSRSTQGR